MEHLYLDAAEVDPEIAEIAEMKSCAAAWAAALAASGGRKAGYAWIRMPQIAPKLASVPRGRATGAVVIDDE